MSAGPAENPVSGPAAAPSPDGPAGETPSAGAPQAPQRPGPGGGFALLRGGLPPPPPDMLQGISHSVVAERVLAILGSMHESKAVYQHRPLGPPEAPGRPAIFVTEEAVQVMASCATWIVYLVARKHKAIFGERPMSLLTLEVVLQYLQLEHPSLRAAIDSLAA